jgi:PTS system N-acetylgalactosamine-specific IIA component
MTSETPRAVVAGHGEFAAGIVSAIEQIAGLGDRFVPVSNTGLSPAGLEDALRAALAATGARVIFTDLPAGSCTLAARRIVRTDPHVVLVSGVALPTLLSYACGAAVEKATEQGRAAITIIGSPDGA